MPLRNCPVVGAEKGKIILEAFTALFPQVLGRGDTFTKRISCLTSSTANLRVTIMVEVLGPKVSAVFPETQVWCFKWKCFSQARGLIQLVVTLDKIFP